MILPKKQGGFQNPLSPQEVAHYNVALGGKYKIGQQLGCSGAETSAYLLTDLSGKQFVLKVPNDPNKIDEWRIGQKKSTQNKESYVSDYQGPIFIPKTIQLGKDFVIEELASDVEFSQKVYDKLSQKEKAKLAKDFAIFLNNSHQRTFQGKGHALELFKPSLKVIFEYFDPALGRREKVAFLNYQNIFESQLQDPQVLTFGDYRSQNMLWDTDKKQLSIIDFDLTKRASVYREFTPDAAASYHSSYQFLKDVINAYNRLPKKHPIHIDSEKVKVNCIIGIYHEFGRCGINRGLLPQDQLRWLRPVRRAIEKAFDPNPEKLARRKQHENT